ncbi:DUF4238 domain-containing protein [Flavobacterium sp. PLA-1-15]|uniref:DUF4238 domain-containing protein n=1 Tax=Flavobacterium sp. PLA-1-15 TaxID=3380533 RepID=UPI003B81519C
MKKPHQHFIPQTYLRKFAHTKDDKNYFVAVYDKQAGKYISDINVSKICAESDFYTLKHLEGDEQYSIENFFADNIENRYNEIYSLLVEKRKQIITPEEKTFILYNTLSMYFRTPKVLNQFVEFTGQLLLDVQQNTNEKTIDFLGYKISLEEKSFKDIKKEIRETNRVNYISTQLALLDEFVKYKFLDGLVVIELVGEQEFITSDNPVEIRNSTENGFNLFSNSNVIYIPLDPKHALFIAPKNNGSIVNEIFYQKDNFVQHITSNYVSYENAERWIIGTKKGVEQSLLDYKNYTEAVEDNHPLLLKFRIKLELMQEILNFAEKGVTNSNSELIESLKALKSHEYFEESADLVEMYNKFKSAGLNL